MKEEWFTILACITTFLSMSMLENKVFFQKDTQKGYKKGYTFHDTVLLQYLRRNVSKEEQQNVV